MCDSSSKHCSPLPPTNSSVMDKTPEKSSFKMGPDRVALLTGTYKRPSPYPDPSERRRMGGPGGSANVSLQSLDSLSGLPATRAVLSAMTPVPSPANSLFNKTQSSVGADFRTSIKRAAIDWKLANKEAEVFKLRADIQRLESVISGRSQSEQEMRISHEKELAKSEVEKQSLASKVRLLEQEVASCRCEIESLRQAQAKLRTSFLPEKESLERTIVELKITDCELRAKALDAEEELKSAKLNYDHDRLKMGHEIKCLNLELESLRTEKNLLEESNRNHKKELAEMASLREQADRLESENKSLILSMKQYEESAELRRLFHDEMDELRRLRQEKSDLREQISAPVAQVIQPEMVVEAAASEEEDEQDLLQQAVDDGLYQDMMSEEEEGSVSSSDPPVPLPVHEDGDGEDQEDYDDDGDDDDDGEEEECFVELEAPGSESDSSGDDSDIAEISSD